MWGPSAAGRGGGRRGRGRGLRHLGRRPGAVPRVPAGAVRHRATPKGAELHRDGGRDHPRAQPVPVHRAGSCSCRPAPARSTATQIERIDNGHVKLARPRATTWPGSGGTSAGCCAEGTPVLDLHSVERRDQHRHLGRAARAAAPRHRGGGRRHRVRRPGAGPIGRRRSTTTRSCSAASASPVGTAPSPPSCRTSLTAAVAAAGRASSARSSLSPRFPIGFARSVDPDVGRAPRLARDRARALLLLALLVVGGAVAVAWRRSGRLGLDAAASPNVVAAAVRRVGPAVGRSRHDDGVRGRARPPQRAGAAGAVRRRRRRARDRRHVHRSSTASTTRSPTPSGPGSPGTRRSWPAPMTTRRRSTRRRRRSSTQLGDQRDASDVAILGRAVLDVDGAGVPVFDVKPVRGTVEPGDDRGPGARVAPDEAAIGPATAEQLGVGDRRHRDHRRRGPPRSSRSSGEALFPNEVHSGFTEGVWVTPETMRVVGPPTDFEKQEGMEQIAALRWRDGVDRDARCRRAATGPCRAAAATIAAAEVPPELVNLRRVRSVPDRARRVPRARWPCRRSPTCSSRRCAAGGASSRCCGRSGSPGA